jgi:hypothetical protein
VVVGIDGWADGMERKIETFDERPVELGHRQRYAMATTFERPREADVRVHVTVGTPAGDQNSGQRGLGNEGTRE